jgi:hypothetical protein
MSKLVDSDLSSSGASLRLFECHIDRSQTQMPNHYLPGAAVVSIAGEGMLQAAGHVPGSYRPRAWRRGEPGVFGKPSRDGAHMLRVRQCGRAKDKNKLWVIERTSRTSFLGIPQVEEALVFAFGNVPIWTRTYQAAMRLAEHCDPLPRPPVVGCWIKV